MQITRKEQLDELTEREAFDWLTTYDVEAKDFWYDQWKLNQTGFIDAVRANIQDFGYQTYDGLPKEQ